MTEYRRKNRVLWKTLTSVRAVLLIVLGNCRFECTCTLDKRPDKSKGRVNRAWRSNIENFILKVYTIINIKRWWVYPRCLIVEWYLLHNQPEETFWQLYFNINSLPQQKCKWPTVQRKMLELVEERDLKQ